MFDAYMKIDGVPGECSAKDYKDWIEIMSYSHAVAQTANMSQSTAGGATTGRTNHENFTISKELDKATALLNQKCSDGSHIPTITVVLCRAGGDKKVPYMEYKLTRCIIASVNINGSDEIPEEEVTFNYGKIEWTYTQQKADDGSGGGKTTGSWNLQTNASK